MTRIWLVTGVLILFITGGALATCTSASEAGAAVSPVVVPVIVSGGQGDPGGAQPIVDIRVGGSSPVPVILDTGSSGLHIFANAVNTGPGSRVTVTSQPANITYSGGHRFTGVVASAAVTIGSQVTAAPVPFALVQKAFCIASKPSCPAAGGIAGFEQSQGAYGILGIGTESSKGDLTSPILGMPGVLGHRWSLHLSGKTGNLVLGAPLPSGSAVTTFSMKTLGTIGGRSLWADDRLHLCVTVGSAQACVLGLFDSGTASVQISGPVLGRVPTTPGTSHVVAELPVAVALRRSSAPFWTFTTGTVKSQNLVRIEVGKGPFINSGVQAFYEFTISYDDVAGTVYLTK